MKHLSALDALLLQLETPDTPMHVGSLMMLERPKRARGDKGAYEAIRRLAMCRLIASYAPLSPRARFGRSSIIRLPTCIGVSGVSSCSNSASRALRCFIFQHSGTMKS